MSNLCHRTGVLKDQLESGLYLLKRVGFYLRKVATAKKNCSVELNKFSDHELEKVNTNDKETREATPLGARHAERMQPPICLTATLTHYLHCICVLIDTEGSH